MNRSHRIFSQRTPSTPTDPQPKEFSHKLDPFHHNYTVTGLIKHIQSTISSLLSKKKESQSANSVQTSEEIKQLSKIQDEVSVLKNILIYNLDQILNCIYPQCSKSKEDPQTNHTTPNQILLQQQLLDRSIPITDFQAENSLSVNNFIPQQHHLSKESESGQSNVEQKISQHLSPQSHHEQKEPQNVIQSRQITPFQLPQHLSFGKMRIQDNQQDQLDLICYEEDEHFSVKKRREERENLFSPIPERAAEEQETAQKKTKQFKRSKKGLMSGDNEDPQTPYFCNSMKKKLFRYTGGVSMPRRLSHKKYNYLQQIHESTH